MIRLKHILLEQSSSKSKGTALKIVGTIQKAMGGAATNEQLILNALNLITTIDIYNEVLSMVKKQPQSEFQRADAIQFPGFAKLGGPGWNSVMEWIQITDFQPLLYGDSEWLVRYAKILKKFSKNEFVGIRPKMQGGQSSVGGDVIGDETTAWDNPEFQHAVLSALQVMAFFIPVVGWFAAAGIGLSNAAMYAGEGDTKQAGIEAIFALLPGVGKIGSTIGKTIPSIGRLGANGMARLGRKLATSKSPVLKELEMLVIKDMSKYKDLIKTDLTEYFKARAKNEAARIAKNATKSKSAQLAGIALNKFAALGIGLGKIGAETTANVTLDNTALSAWDKVYAGAGLDKQAGGNIVLDPDIAAYAKDPEAYMKTNQFYDLMK